MTAARGQQAEMFDALPPDETQRCAKCGTPIVTQHFTAGYVESAFVGDDGECWNCNSTARKKLKGDLHV